MPRLTCPCLRLYACAFINYQSGNGANGFHRQLSIVGGFQQVYSTQLQLAGLQTFSDTQFRYPACICDEINGVRAMAADLIFPGESVSSSSASSSSSNTFSKGATAGIAVGVAVGAIILTSLVWCFLGGALAGIMNRSGGKAGKSRRFENDDNSTDQSANQSVEMHTSTEEGNVSSE